MYKSLQPKKKVPFSFVLDELDSLAVVLKPMFGSVMVYLNEKMVLFLCERDEKPFQKGIWVATTPEHFESLAGELSLPLNEQPSKMGNSSWLPIPAEAAEFERQVLRVCELILNGDPRVGHLPKPKSLKPGKKDKKLSRKARTKS